MQNPLLPEFILLFHVVFFKFRPGKEHLVNITKNYVKVNGEGVSSPYTIKVIGDSDKLRSSLIGAGYVDSIQGWGQEINFEEKKKVEIGKYSSSMKTEYMNDTSNK